MSDRDRARDRVRDRDRDNDRERRRDKEDRDRERERGRSKRSRTPERSRTSRHTRSGTRSPDRHRSRSPDDRSNRRSHRHPPSPKRRRRSDSTDERERQKVVSDFVDGIVKEQQQKHKDKDNANGGADGHVEEGVDEDELEMMKKLGIPIGFDSTKGKPVPGADVSGVRAVTKRQPRQYMNRRGGFNRPLPAEQNRWCVFVLSRWVRVSLNFWYFFLYVQIFVSVILWLLVFNSWGTSLAQKHKKNQKWGTSLDEYGIEWLIELFFAF